MEDERPLVEVDAHGLQRILVYFEKLDDEDEDDFVSNLPLQAARELVEGQLALYMVNHPSVDVEDDTYFD